VREYQIKVDIVGFFGYNIRYSSRLVGVERGVDAK
jgi:hypothetical protein